MAEERIAAVKTDWETQEMPRQHAVFTLKRVFSEEELKNLSYGNVPQEMEDKWFYYVEEGKLYAHRSWTGFCIFIMELGEPGSTQHKVTYNTSDEVRFSGKQDAEETLNSLLDFWVLPRYDYYHEFIMETAESLEKMKKRPEN